MGDLVLALLSGVLLALILLLLNFVPARRKYSNNIPYGSMGYWPFLGETLSFLKPHQSNSIGSFLESHCSRYGKVFKSHLFGSPTIVSCDHEMNMFILQNEEKLFQCSYPKPIHGILGNLSLLVVVGDVHKKLRNVALSFTNTCKSKPEYLHDIEKLTVSCMQSWKNKNEVVFCDEAKKFTFNLMVKQILSMEPDDPLCSNILQDFQTFMKGLVSIPLYIPGTPYGRAVKARARICSTVRAIMRERGKGNVGLEKRDFLDVLLSNTSISSEGKVSIVLDLLLGGYETTSILMSTTVYFLGQYSQHALDKLKSEHRVIRERKKGGETLDWEDYKQMQFTHYVINEALRCGNVVKFVHRKALKDVNFKGYHIPCGWRVLPVFSAVHLDPSLHENASQFDPWRWAVQEPVKNVAPFGGGPRLCPGAELAKIETAFFLHHLVLSYRWMIKETDHPLAYPYVEFKKGLPIEIELQDSSS
ncbi:hypothetical protein Scep_017996 [Stephania cephalantha]|uniref:Cytochrome P450 724B1 n=1 Tax=Stephania cephalantha TaxID=152367 RepID=A0AAP0NUT2_9MAGN